MSRAAELLLVPIHRDFVEYFFNQAVFPYSTSLASHSCAIFFYPAGNVAHWYADERIATQRWWILL